MAEELIRPIDEYSAQAIAETAKFGTKFLETIDKGGSYGASVFGSLPHDIVGVIGADWLRHFRARRCAKFSADTLRILHERGRTEPFEEVSPSLGRPLIEAAIDETRAELSILWAKLLAAALDPSRKELVRSSFITTLKQMDPLDARALDAIQTHYPGGVTQMPNGREYLCGLLKVSLDELLVSFARLGQLGLVEFSPADAPKYCPIMSSYGRLLLSALR